MEELSGVTQGVMLQSRERKELSDVFTVYRERSTVLVKIDREKAKACTCRVAINDPLGVYMGSVYVNDFDFNDRSYRVYVQADKGFRSKAQDMKEFYVRSDKGTMVPLENLIGSQTTSPQVISHYNLFRSAEIDGSAAPGKLRRRDRDDGQLAAKLPPGFSYNWTGLSLEEMQSGGASMIYLASAFWSCISRFPRNTKAYASVYRVAGRSHGVARGGRRAELRGQENDVFCQVGLVMLVGLSSKNAILIVEFAEQLRESGVSLVESAVESATIRLRPILMTSLAFILGVVPLVVATAPAGSAVTQWARPSLAA